MRNLLLYFFRLSILSKINLSIQVLISILSLSAYFKFESYSNFLIIGLLLLWILVSIIETPNFFLKPSFFLLLFILFNAYILLISIFANAQVIANRYFALSIISIFFFFRQRNLVLNHNKSNIIVLWVVLIFSIVTSIITLYFYSVEPNISRVLIKKSVKAIEYSKYGVGGYDFIYYLVILSSFIFGFILRSKIKNRIYYFFITIFILFSINIMKSNYMTAFLVYVIGLIFYFSFFNSRKFITNILFFISLLTIAYLSLSIVFSMLESYFYGSLNYDRIKELKNLFETGSSSANVDGRSNLWLISLDLLTNHPFIGGIVETIQNQDGSLIRGLFSEHSHIFDTFAIFGIFIGLFQILIYIYPIKYEIGLKKNMYSIVLLQLLLIFTFNTAVPAVGLGVYFIIPTLYKEYFR